MIASVVGGQQYSRQDTKTYIMAERDIEGVFRGSCLNKHQSSRIDCYCESLNAGVIS